MVPMAKIIAPIGHEDAVCQELCTQYILILLTALQDRCLLFPLKREESKGKDFLNSTRQANSGFLLLVVLFLFSRQVGRDSIHYGVQAWWTVRHRLTSHQQSGSGENTSI